MEAVKHDSEKNRLDLIPPEALEASARAFTYGATKYGDHNWRGGLSHSRLYGALLRHLNAWWSGEIQDESGLSHLDHAGACLAMLQHNEVKREDLDDRYEPSKGKPN